MEHYTFHFPTRLVTGRGTFAQATAEIAPLGKSALVISDAGTKAAADTLKGQLASSGVTASFLEVTGNQATFAEATKAAKAGRDAQATVIVALGGGTVQDLSRIAAFGLFDPDKIWETVGGLSNGTGSLDRVVPICSIPTLASCSNSTSAGGALTHADFKQRVPFAHDSLFPKIAILDGELTFGCSTEETAESALAILGQVADGYLSSVENTPIQDRLAESCAETILENLPVVAANPAHYSARANLLWTAQMAQSGLTSTGRGTKAPVTQVARILSAHFGISHSVAMTILLPAYMMAIHQAEPQRIAQFFHALFGLPVMSPTMEEAARKGVMQLKKWFHQQDSYYTLVSIGLKMEDLDGLADVVSTGVGGSLQGIVDLDRPGILTFLQQAMQ